MVLYAGSNFSPDNSLGYLARRVFQLSQAGLESVFAPEGLTLTQWQALVSIHFGHGDTCAELAREIAYDKGATTRLVDTLAERGWVERSRDDGDRRVVNLSLTDAGVEVASRCRLRVIDCWNTWLENWETDDAAQLVRLLQRLRDTLTEAAA